MVIPWPLFRVFRQLGAQNKFILKKTVQGSLLLQSYLLLWGKVVFTATLRLMSSIRYYSFQCGCHDELSLNEVSLNIVTSIINPLDFETLGRIIPDRYPTLDGPHTDGA